MEFYAHDIVKYLKNRFFNNKDLSAIKQALLEVFYNIFDHADAQNNAFSFMKYDKREQVLYVAVCDFGRGIADSIRGVFCDIKNDKDALLKATEDRVTIQSKAHNRGMGLGEIIHQIQEGGSLRILSNAAFLVYKDGCIEIFDAEFNFGGTLIYYNIPLSNFEDIEEIDNFDLNF